MITRSKLMIATEAVDEVQV